MPIGRLVQTLIGLLVVLIGLAAVPVQAEDAPENHADPITAYFAQHDPSSGTKIDHRNWTAFLSRTVVYSGNSIQRLGRAKKQRGIGSSMSFGNNAPTRYENNRVVLGEFTEEHLSFIRQYRVGLQNLAALLPVTALRRNEQLAFWLNLYNAHVMEIVAERYPAAKGNGLRSAPGKKAKGVWHEKTLQVAGHDLSLSDIETKILFPIWKDPLVLYGLWQGTVGGPKLPLTAYRGARVWTMLRENAWEFVNSNRGMKPSGSTLNVSLMYGWASPLFADDEGLREHIAGLAQEPFDIGLGQASKVKVKLYDWYLADLSGGRQYQGPNNNLAGLFQGLTSGNGAPTSAPGGPPSQAEVVSGGSASTSAGQLLIAASSRIEMRLQGLPVQSQNLLAGMSRYNDRRRREIVTLDECPPESGCVAVPFGDDGGEN